jgi:hypothetical protein
MEHGKTRTDNMLARMHPATARTLLITVCGIAAWLRMACITVQGLRCFLH